MAVGDLLEFDLLFGGEEFHYCCLIFFADGVEAGAGFVNERLRFCLAAGLAEPEFNLNGCFVTTIQRKLSQEVTGQVDAWIIRVLHACLNAPLKSSEIQKATGIRHRETFQRNYLDLLLSGNWVERTIPENPTSRLQQYRLS